MSTTVEFDLTTEQVEALLKLPPKGAIRNRLQHMGANVLAALHARLSGPTKIEVSEAGIRVSRAGGTQEFDWAVMRMVADRPLAWCFTLKPTGMHIIPKSTLTADQQLALSAQLRGWAGRKYKLRKE